MTFKFNFFVYLGCMVKYHGVKTLHVTTVVFNREKKSYKMKFYSRAGTTQL